MAGNFARKSLARRTSMLLPQGCPVYWGRIIADRRIQLDQLRVDGSLGSQLH